MACPLATIPMRAQRVAFFRSLRLSELALAHACVLGRDAAWQRFLSVYRAPLTQAAIAITGSATVGHELADSLYAELYGLRELDGQRRSPLASYSGRGSLLGWLRTTLAQRHIDYHRRTRREAPLDNVDPPAPGRFWISPGSAELARLTDAVSRSLRGPRARRTASCSASYFLDRQSLLEISRVLRVHEATVSRRLKRLVADLRKRLIHNLQSGGLSKRAAEEALGADPRDIELNLRALLQTSQTPPFFDKTASLLTPHPTKYERTPPIRATSRRGSAQRLHRTRSAGARAGRDTRPSGHLPSLPQHRRALAATGRRIAEAASGTSPAALAIWLESGMAG